MNSGMGVLRSFEFPIWILFLLLVFTSAFWLWTAIRRHKKNKDDGIRMQKRIHQTINNSANGRNPRENRQLAEQLKKLTDEANDLFRRLLEKHGSSEEDSSDDNSHNQSAE